MELRFLKEKIQKGQFDFCKAFDDNNQDTTGKVGKVINEQG